MKHVMLYHENGAVYECETEERLESFLANGWSKTKPKKKVTPPEEEEATGEDEPQKPEE